MCFILMVFFYDVSDMRTALLILSIVAYSELFDMQHICSSISDSFFKQRLWDACV